MSNAIFPATKQQRQLKEQEAYGCWDRTRKYPQHHFHHNRKIK